jgi:hypothetical protein
MTQELLLSEIPAATCRPRPSSSHDADKVIRQRQHQLDTLTAEIEQAIALDRDLKNETTAQSQAPGV